MNTILICKCCSQIFELCHAFKGPIPYLYANASRVLHSTDLTRLFLHPIFFFTLINRVKSPLKLNGKWLCSCFHNSACFFFPFILLAHLHFIPSFIPYFFPSLPTTSQVSRAFSSFLAITSLISVHIPLRILHLRITYNYYRKYPLNANGFTYNTGVCMSLQTLFS
jgi:hypothetical protein